MFGSDTAGSESVKYGQSNMETCITIRKIASQRESAAWLRELKLSLVTA